MMHGVPPELMAAGVLAPGLLPYARPQLVSTTTTNDKAIIDRDFAFVVQPAMLVFVIEQNLVGVDAVVWAVVALYPLVTYEYM